MSDDLPTWATSLPHPCITLRCSDCDQDLSDLGDDGSLPHFLTLGEAIRDHETHYGWVMDGGAFRCRSCAGRIACEVAGGHVFRTLDGSPYRYCEREDCGHTERVPDAEIDAELHALLSDGSDQ